MKYLVIAGVAVAVLLLMRQAQARQSSPYDPANWEYLPDYRPGSGLIT